MGRITDISKQKRNKSRVSVFIDGEFVCGLDIVTAAAARIKVGDEISAEELKNIVRDSERNSAFERAVGYLSLAPRSKKEMRKYLLDKGYEFDTVDYTLQKLDAYRYTDDRAYAQSYIRSKSKKYGAFRIAAELKQKGIDHDIISELLDDDGDSDNAVTEVARRYVVSHKSADVQKLKRFLAGRGFSWDGISEAIAKLRADGAFSETCDDSGDDEYCDGPVAP